MHISKPHVKASAMVRKGKDFWDSDSDDDWKPTDICKCYVSTAYILSVICHMRCTMWLACRCAACQYIPFNPKSSNPTASGSNQPPQDSSIAAMHDLSYILSHQLNFEYALQTLAIMRQSLSSFGRILLVARHLRVSPRHRSVRTTTRSNALQ